jgi:hypothetical protein
MSLNPWLAATTKYTVGGEKQLSHRLGIFSPRLRKEKELPVRLYGEAKLKRINEHWELASLKVDRSPPSAEELAALRRVEEE